MEHLAIDLGGRESQVCIRSEDATILKEGKHATTGLERVLAKQPHCRVILETSAEAFRVADQALACGHEVRVVPATLVKSLGVGSRGVKNDRRDAQILSEVQQANFFVYSAKATAMVKVAPKAAATSSRSSAMPKL